NAAVADNANGLTRKLLLREQRCTFSGSGPPLPSLPLNDARNAMEPGQHHRKHVFGYRDRMHAAGRGTRDRSLEKRVMQHAIDACRIELDAAQVRRIFWRWQLSGEGGVEDLDVAPALAGWLPMSLDRPVFDVKVWGEALQVLQPVCGDGRRDEHHS